MMEKEINVYSSITVTNRFTARNIAILSTIFDRHTTNNAVKMPTGCYVNVAVGPCWRPYHSSCRGCRSRRRKKARRKERPTSSRKNRGSGVATHPKHFIAGNLHQQKQRQRNAIVFPTAVSRFSKEDDDIKIWSQQTIMISSELRDFSRLHKI